MSQRQLYFAVSEIAARFGVPTNKVCRWIANGELAAVDVSESRGERPRWRIHIDEIERFERDRRSAPAAKPVKRASRKQMAGIHEFVK